MLRLLTTSVLIGMCIGCGTGGAASRAPVEGKVTLDGTPVQDGSITFVPTGGTKGPSAGGPIQGGRYSLPAADGPVVGRHRVEIRAPQPTGKKLPDPYQPGKTVDQVLDAVPERYNTASTLERDVNSGRNVIDFELTTR